jgi:hypothetical protein
MKKIKNQISNKNNSSVNILIIEENVKNYYKIKGYTISISRN